MAQGVNDRAQGKLNNEAQTVGLLSDAGKLTQQRLDMMSQAHTYGGTGMLFSVKLGHIDLIYANQMSQVLDSDTS
jgi:hypothetical protein